MLRAAAELIAVRGYSATSTRDIAAAVGVEQPAIYKHFSAKGDILAALVTLSVELPLEVINELKTLPAPAAVKLHRYLQESLNHLHGARNVLVAVLTTPELRQEPFAAQQLILFQLGYELMELIKKGQDEGDLRPMNPATATGLLQALTGAMGLPMNAASPDEVVDFAMTGLLVDHNKLAQIKSAADALDLAAAQHRDGALAALAP